VVSAEAAGEDAASTDQWIAPEWIAPDTGSNLAPLWPEFSPEISDFVDEFYYLLQIITIILSF
jgi:hypothetical protein